LNFRNFLRNNRGIGLRDITGIAIMVVIAGIVIGIGSEVLEDVKTTATCDTWGTDNETINFAANATNYSLTKVPANEEIDVCGGASSLLSVKNASHDIKLGNFSWNGSHITLPECSTGTGTIGTGNYLVTYNYSIWSRSQLVARNASEGAGELAKWMPTIGLVIAAAIIVGIIFTSFMRGRE